MNRLKMNYMSLFLFFSAFLVTNSFSSYEDDIQVSHFLANTGRILGTDASFASRHQRYLPEAMNAVNKSFSDLVDLIYNFITTVIDNLMHLNWSRPTVRDFLPNMDDSKIVLYESIVTIVFGSILALTWPSVAMFGTLVYYLLAGITALGTIIFRLLSDEEYLMGAARTIGTQGTTVEMELLKVISKGLSQSYGTYSFLNDLNKG